MSDAVAAGNGRQAAGPAWWEWLFTPFRYVAGAASFGLGLAAVLLAGALGYVSKTHFDGVLDMHTGAAFPRWVFLAEGLVDWLSLTVVLLLLGKLLSRTAFRALDLIGTQAMARWPTVIAAVAALLPGYQRAVAALPGMLTGGRLQATPIDLAMFAVATLFSLLALVWMVALMYQSYRTCCNLRGVRAVVSFVLGVLAAEVVSKYALAAVLLRR
jgi:hypothetical protein